MALKIEHKQLPISLTRVGAVAAISANTLVKTGASDELVVTCTANARPVGVVVENLPVGLPGRVEIGGVVPVKCGAALATVGLALVSDATGRVVEIGSTGNQNIVGYNLSITSNANDLVSVLLNPTTKYQDTTGGGVGTATMVVGAELPHADHIINVAIQLKDIYGADLAIVGSVIAYFSSDAAGKDAITSTVSTETAVGTDGSLTILLAKSTYLLVSEADGDIDLNLVKVDGAATIYLNLVLPNGKIVTSGAITFSA